MLLVSIPVTIPPVSDELDECPSQESQGGDNTVGNDSRLALPNHVETNSAIDHTQGQQDATPPDMRIADKTATSSLAVMPVVKPTQNRLDC